jgi:hypothetical protein
MRFKLATGFISPTSQSPYYPEEDRIRAILVNNAGIDFLGAIEEQEERD